MSARERRATWSLALIYSVRMLGLFIILPVFSLFATNYANATPVLIGLAMGIYGLLQAILQVPFGMLSDRIGRKRVIALGLLLLALGSAIAASADDIWVVILGRALQGAGAIAAVLMALAADLTREQQRTKVMAFLGASIGMSFLIALMLGPVLIGWYSIDMLFWLTAATALAAIGLLYTVVPDPEPGEHVLARPTSRPSVRSLLSDTMLLRLDASIFLLHLMITATFFAVPLALRNVGLAADLHWQIYVPAVLISVLMMVPMMIVAERRAMRGAMLASVVGLALTQALLAGAAAGLVPASVAWLFVGVTLFFGFMNALEALLPSLVSRLAPPEIKGGALGIYSSSQFLGAFTGGAGAGVLYGALGAAALHVVLALLGVVWALILLGFRPPARRRSGADSGVDSGADRVASMDQA